MDRILLFRHRDKTGRRCSYAARGVTLCLLGCGVLLVVGVAGEAEQSEPRPGGATNPTDIPALMYGTIMAVDLRASPPTLTLTTQEGHPYVFPVDAKLTMVWSQDQLDAVPLNQVKIGAHVEVHYGKKQEKQLADQILILEDPAVARRETLTFPHSLGHPIAADFL